MYDVNENSREVMVTLVLSYPPLTDLTLMVFATDGSAIGKNIFLLFCMTFKFSVGGGQDYNSGPYNVTFTIDIPIVSFPIPIIDDQILEQDEIFYLDLQSLPDNVIVGDISQATVAIVNDEGKYIPYCLELRLGHLFLSSDF